MLLFMNFEELGWSGDGIFFFSSRRRHTRCSRDWSSDVCSSDLHLVCRLLLEKKKKKVLQQTCVDRLEASHARDNADKGDEGACSVTDASLCSTYRRSAQDTAPR